MSSPQSIDSPRRKRRLCFTAACAAAACAPSACAIHYYDPETGTEHLWGIGHMKVKVTPVNEGVRAVVRGVDIVGVGAGRDDKYGYVTVGFQSRQRLEVFDQIASIRLEWFGNDFANVRVGSEAPARTFLRDQYSRP